MSSFQIPTPCHENWDEMTPVEQGRHCQKCVKTVHDVTNWSDEKIDKTYYQNNQSLCIRVPEERIVATNKNKPLSRNWRYYLILILATFVFYIKKGLVAKARVIEPKFSEPKDSLQKISKMVIRGVVKDTINLESPLQFATVVISQDSNSIGGILTDEKGLFQLTIEKEFSAEDSIQVEVQYIGFEPVSRSFMVKDSLDLEIFMGDQHICGRLTTVVLHRRIFVGENPLTGIMINPKNNWRSIYNTIMDEYDTKHIHHQELERLNLRD